MKKDIISYSGRVLSEPGKVVTRFSVGIVFLKEVKDEWNKSNDGERA